MDDLKPFIDLSIPRHTANVRLTEENLTENRHGADQLDPALVC
jgi:hypothetical protein